MGEAIVTFRLILLPLTHICSLHLLGLILDLFKSGISVDRSEERVSSVLRKETGAFRSLKNSKFDFWKLSIIDEEYPK